MKRVISVLLVALLTPVMVRAQTPQSPAQEPSEETPAVDPTKLGVSLDRIKRELAQAEVVERNDGVLKLSFTVQVIGQAPKINLLEGFSLEGPSQYGGPTHREVLDVLTPQEFKAPAVPFSALAVMAAQWLHEKSKKQRCEEEIEQYRRLVMGGVAVAAPRCTQ